MKKLFSLILLTLLVSACSETNKLSGENVQSAEETQIAFAADFENGGGCRSGKNSDGCDLYMAYITGDGDVRAVKRLTDTDTAETFPVWNPNGKIIYFNSQAKGGTTFIPPDINYFEVDTGEIGTLVKNSSHPTVTQSGDKIIYSALPKHVLTQSTLSSNKITDTSVLLEGEERYEPGVSGDGILVVFHEITDTNAGASIYNVLTKQITNISKIDGTGHCAINQSGTLAVCDQKSGGGLAGTAIVSGEIGTSYLAVSDLKIPEISKLDEDYAVCDLASTNYPAFFDNETLLVSVSCHQRVDEGLSDSLFSKLFLVNLQTNIFIPLGKNLASAYGGPGKNSYTAQAQ